MGARAVTRSAMHKVAFALAVALGAFLLFQVQPLIARYILPWFGGGPAVWTTCMLFFQAMLLVGYAYAHGLSRLPAMGQSLIHVAMLLGAMLMLPIIPSERWMPTPQQNPVIAILVLLLVHIGLPYVVLAGTSPLMQSWYARVLVGQSPYRLYALSNAASLMALLSYPTVVEPLLGRVQQAWMWMIGLGVFVVVSLYCAFLSRGPAHAFSPVGVREMTGTAGGNQSTRSAAVIHNPNQPFKGGEGVAGGWGAVWLWMVLPACASVLLLAITNRLSQDIAPVPLLWVVPLSIYLLTFILAFDSPRWYARRLFAHLLPLALVGATWIMLWEQQVALVWQILVYCAILFIFAMSCHGELYRLRPSVKGITAYYLMIAAGGALGGLMVAVVAPVVFDDYFELHWGLLLTTVLLVGRWIWEGRAVMGAVFSPAHALVIVALIVISGYGLYVHATRPLEGAVRIEGSRNFYGRLMVYEVHQDDPHRHHRLLHHAGTAHGLQFMHPERRSIPTAYYDFSSGMGRVILAMQQARPQAPLNVGAVGMGIGTIAAYNRPLDRLTFYEIDPDVIEVARRWFYFLPEAKGEVFNVLGDARLSLARQPGQEFDLLVLDAFSGDSIPTHLLTVESMQVYRRHLAVGGIILIHISNQHLELEPLAAALADEAGMSIVLIHRQADEAQGAYSSLWAALWERGSTPLVDPSALGILPGSRRVRPWTDDYSNLLAVFKRPFRGTGGG